MRSVRGRYTGLWSPNCSTLLSMLNTWGPSCRAALSTTDAAHFRETRIPRFSAIDQGAPPRFAWRLLGGQTHESTKVWCRTLAFTRGAVVVSRP